MAPSRRAQARTAAATLRPFNTPLPPPRSTVNDQLSPNSLAHLEQSFLATLPKGHLRDVTPEERARLMHSCPGLDGHLLRRWWLARQWEERRQRKEEQERRSVDVGTAAVLPLPIPPPSQPAQQQHDDSQYTPTRSIHPYAFSAFSSPTAFPGPVPAKSPPPPPAQEQQVNSPPRLCRSRLTVRLHTQPRQNPFHPPGVQPRFVRAAEVADPFASPRGGSALRLGDVSTSRSLGEGEIAADQAEAREEDTPPLATRIQRLVNGGEEQHREEGGAQVFNLDDVYQLSRLGVNEAEDGIVFFRCQALFIGSWTRTLNMLEPELMFYFSPATSCFQAWTAHDSHFYRISLPISSILSIRIFHDLDLDTACIIFTRSHTARPNIAFAESKPMTLHWSPTLHDFTIGNQATREPRMCIVVQGAGAAMKALEGIAEGEERKAEGAGRELLGKVWWGPWESQGGRTKVEDLRMAMEGEAFSSAESQATAAEKGESKLLEYEHPRFPTERIWCRPFLDLQSSLDDTPAAPFAPGQSQPNACIPPSVLPAAPISRVPWLVPSDPTRRVLAPWPNPTFPPPAHLDSNFGDVDLSNPTLAGPYSPSPEKRGEETFRPYAGETGVNEWTDEKDEEHFSAMRLGDEEGVGAGEEVEDYALGFLLSSYGGSYSV